MPKPKPDPKEVEDRNREQSRKRMRRKRSLNKKDDGKDLSGTIDKATADDLKAILDFKQKTNAKETEIGVVRWAIRYIADQLRKEGKIK